MKKQAGFTLIELVAVLVILALLGAMAVPRFVDMQSEALAAAKNGTRNAVKTAHSLYIAKNRAVPTVTQLAGAVTADGAIGTAAGDAGITVVIDATTYTIATFQDPNCGTPTANTTPGTTDLVQCIGAITP